MPEKNVDWKAIQKHFQYTDEELETLRAHPKWSKLAPEVFSEEFQKKYLVVEVVSSHGCAAGMRPGDRLLFKGLSLLDNERSSPWCVHALGNIWGFANMVHDRFVHGLDPNNMVYNHFSCADTGLRFGGMGLVIMKACVLDEGDL
jgi:uncharacterized repeat protein (TIGR04076 family)